MLRIRDISLRHRLLVANFTMVFVPLAILTVLGFLLISGLRFSSPHNDLTTLWPEKGPALSIQYTVSSLRVKAERPGPLKVKDMREDCQVLEELGIATAISAVSIIRRAVGHWRRKDILPMCYFLLIYII